MPKIINSPKIKLAEKVGNLSDRLEEWACQLATPAALTNQAIDIIGKFSALKSHLFHHDLETYDINQVSKLLADQTIQELIIIIDKEYGSNLRKLLGEAQVLQAEELIKVYH